MAIYGEDTDIEKLLSGVKSLFQQKSPATQSAKPSSPAANPAPSGPVTPGAFQCPIKGTWHNLGGFDPGMVRYDGRVGHKGVDMSAPAGTPIYSFGPGVVTTVGTDGRGGNIAVINHGNNVTTYYAHMASVKVFKGDKVDTDTMIGTVGNTGNAGNPNDPLKTQEGGRTWPHLHFEVKEHGTQVDPARFFSVPKYDPAFAKNPGKYQKFWLSDDAKQEAQSFSMKDHVQQKRVAFSAKVDALLKYTYQFTKLVSK